MKAKPAIADVVTPEVRAYVRAYLLARAYAETMRERVNAIYRDILTECPIYADRTGEQILDKERLFLSSDEDAVQDAFEEGNKRLRAAGLKPTYMPDSHCPALVAEHLQIKVERQIVESAGRPFGITPDRLLCAGLEKYNEFVRLTVGLVVNQPDFKSPL